MVEPGALRLRADGAPAASLSQAPVSATPDRQSRDCPRQFAARSLARPILKLVGRVSLTASETLRVPGERSETRTQGPKLATPQSIAPRSRLSLRLRLRIGRDTQGM